MKQFLLFAGTENSKAVGVNGFAGDFDTAADAYLSLVDHQTASEWWQILDTQTGEVTERRHLRVSNGTIVFQRSERVLGTSSRKVAVSLPTVKDTNLTELEAGLRTVVVNGVKGGNGHANGGVAAEH